MISRLLPGTVTTTTAKATITISITTISVHTAIYPASIFRRYATTTGISITNTTQPGAATAGYRQNDPGSTGVRKVKRWEIA
ncbi:MAG: hypothetical protein H6559_32050 [Lewinellaceae bacterium]|nr:hypothetical protein [Lewinellaceae bacterium]